MTDRLNEEAESRRKMADKLSHERHTSQKEKETTQEVGVEGHMTLRLSFSFTRFVFFLYLIPFALSISLPVADRRLEEAVGNAAAI